MLDRGRDDRRREVERSKNRTRRHPMRRRGQQPATQARYAGGGRQDDGGCDTSSDNYPYSEAYHGSLPGFRGRNYLRNSVKAVVDAYNGTVPFYVFGADDPIIKAYQNMLPGLFRERSEMPANLQRHIRYPEDLFTVQAEMYGTYHMTNPATFYNREDRWEEVPHELYREREIELQPYYVMAQLPRAESPEFILMLPLSVAGKNQMAGWLAGWRRLRQARRVPLF